MADPPDALETVPDLSVLWKYLDFRKFVSVLERQALYFSSPKQFDDPFEGTFPAGFLDMLPTNEMEAELARTLLKAQTAVAVDCWHLNEYESEAMWKIYSGERGIAIQTTASRLLASLGDHHAVELRRVQYIDYSDPTAVSDYDVFSPFQCKRKSFEHEREVRAISTDIESSADGRYFAVDTDTLIQEVFVAPKSEPWFYELVRSVLSRYGLTKPVRWSSLFDDPSDRAS